VNVLFETTWLAPGGTQAASRVRLNGRQLVDEADFFRAVTAAFYPRGNLGVVFSFQTQWQFNTTKDGEVFALTHISNLPMGPDDTGVVQCVCGYPPSTQTVYLNNAVLESANIVQYDGESVTVEYTLRGPSFQTDIPPDIPSYPDPDELTLVYRRSSVAIASAATSVAVTFSSPFTTNPVVVAVVTGVTGSVAIFCRVLSDTVTTSGFTAELSVATPDNTYTLNYWAVQ
jgi:hypothetical protein